MHHFGRINTLLCLHQLQSTNLYLLSSLCGLRGGATIFIAV